jgi:hypothetical protein
MDRFADLPIQGRADGSGHGNVWTHVVRRAWQGYVPTYQTTGRNTRSSAAKDPRIRGARRQVDLDLPFQLKDAGSMWRDNPDARRLPIQIAALQGDLEPSAIARC